MFKQLCLLTRRPGMSMEEFQDYYETSHARIAAALLPSALRYQRRFVRPETNLIAGRKHEIGFDCLMELWWESREAFEAAMASIGEGDGYRALYEDEEKVFASHDNPVFSVEEHESAMAGFEDTPAPGGLRDATGADGGMLKLVFLIKRKPGMSMDEFKAYYEANHRRLGERALAGAQRYVRRYVVPEKNPITREEIELPFDVVMEIWWASRQAWENSQKVFTNGDLFTAIYEDEEKLFASHDNPAFTVVEGDSPMRGW